MTLGVYLLGALEPDERSAFETHLASCESCRSELVRLAPLPGLLHQISPEDFEDLHEHPLPPAPVGEPVHTADLSPAAVGGSGTHRSRRRYWLVAAAALVAVMISVVAGYGVLRETEVGASSVSWSATNPQNGVSAQARLIARDWGTEIQVRMSDVPAYRDCKLVVRARDGYRQRADYAETAGWWKTGHDPDEEVPASTSIDLADIRSLEFVDDGKQVLVTIVAPGT